MPVQRELDILRQRKRQKLILRNQLPEQLVNVTGEAAASCLLYRDERDSVASSATFGVMMKVAYGVNISHKGTNYMMRLEGLTAEQLRKFCSHLGVPLRRPSSANKFDLRRALWAYFTKDYSDKTLEPLSKQVSSGSSDHARQGGGTNVPHSSSLSSTAMSQEVGLNTFVRASNPVPENTSSSQPIQQGINNNGKSMDASGQERFSSVRIKQSPNGDGAIGKHCSQSIADHGSSHSEGAAASVQQFHSVRIKTESCPHADMANPPSILPWCPENNPTESSEANANLFLPDFLSEINQEYSDTNVDPSSIHPYLLLAIHQNNDFAQIAEMETSVQEPFPSGKHHDFTGHVEIETSIQEPLLSEKNHASPGHQNNDFAQIAEMETSVQEPFPSGKHHDLAGHGEIETSIQEHLLSEKNHASADHREMEPSFQGPFRSEKDNTSADHQEMETSGQDDENDDSTDHMHRETSVQMETSVQEPFPSGRHHDFAGHEEIEASIQEPLLSKKNRASADHVALETSVQEPCLSEKNHASADYVAMEPSLQEPFRSEKNHASADHREMETSVQDDKNDDSTDHVHTETSVPVPVRSEKNHAFADHGEMETSAQDDKNHDSTDHVYTETSLQVPFPFENNGSPATGRDSVATSSNPTNIEQEPNPQVPEERSLQRMEQQRSEMDEKGVFQYRYFKKDMDVDDDLRKEDLALRKEDLALRKQDLALKRKRNLQDAMNQTLQNYMNPACPPEIKDALMAQWKLMDAEIKFILS